MTTPIDDNAWLVVIDPQVIFADPTSDWASPFFVDAFANIARLAEAFGDRVIVTRWVPTADRETSWGEYFAAWPFADNPEGDHLFDLVPEAQHLATRPTVDRPTFGKWSAELTDVTGSAPHLVLTGVSTDCCVISTALAAADAGAWLTVATDGCAGSTAENHAAAVQVMSLYPPQISLKTTQEILATVSD